MRAIFCLILVGFLNVSAIHDMKQKQDFCFDFDEVMYYHTDIDEQYDAGPAYLKNENDLNDTFPDRQKLDLILSDSYPKSLTDSLFFNDLPKYNYVLNLIEKPHHIAIKSMFCPTNSNDKSIDMCMPLYRDILVFKNNDKIVGLAKICFSCSQIYLLNQNEVPFGLWFDLNYRKLSQFLYNE
ncbi:MAG: hypothetical protein ACI8ZM_001089 [Crocinitomix sp.]|jgi:hypothetical protein